jgi:erythromycin esterase
MTPPLRVLPLLACTLLLAACDSTGTTPVEEAQTPVEWLRTNAHPISISPADRDFRDLEPLRAAIGSSRVVMLGEESHGDGQAFLAKARLIAFLHEEMGFDVLVWESGLYDVDGVWRHVMAGESVLSASRRGVFGVWNRSEQVMPLLDYVAGTLGTAHPLEMAGFDNQFTGSLARDSVAAHVLAFARRIGSSVAADTAWPAAAATLTELAVTQHYDFKPPAADQDRVLRLLGTLRTDALARAAGDRDALFWAQALRSTDSYARMMWAAPPGQFRGEDSNLRDRQMGENLVWLANTYHPGRKIIVWAASGHIGREMWQLRSSTGGHPYASGWTVQMGGEAYRTLGAQVYSIGFTAARGTFGVPGFTTQTLSPLPNGALEVYFLSTAFENAFVDFRSRPAGGDWLKDVYARPFGYQDLRGDWTAVFDGMVYQRDMTPNTQTTR